MVELLDLRVVVVIGNLMVKLSPNYYADRLIYHLN